MRAPDKKPRCTGPTSGGGKSGGGGKAGAATGSSAKSELAAALKWLNSYPRVSRWMAQYDIEALVDAGGLGAHGGQCLWGRNRQAHTGGGWTCFWLPCLHLPTSTLPRDGPIVAGGGIVRIDNFLPEQVARGALAILRRLPPGRWRPTGAPFERKRASFSGGLRRWLADVATRRERATGWANPLPPAPHAAATDDVPTPTRIVVLQFRQRLPRTTPTTTFRTPFGASRAA